MDLPSNSDLKEHHDELSAQEMYNLVSSVISVIHWKACRNWRQIQPAIDNLQDALAVYENAVAYQSELQEALAAAMDRLWDAMEDVHNTQGRLGEADFHLGRTRYILKKSGYGDIFGKKSGRTILNGVIKINSHLFLEIDGSLNSRDSEEPIYSQAWLRFVTIKCNILKNIGALELSRMTKQILYKIDVVRVSNLN